MIRVRDLSKSFDDLMANRGIEPNLANVTINNQTASAPEPESRTVKLDDIPSALIGSVTVVKSLTADLDANAIAGQVDINTLTAFDRKKNILSARLRALTDDLPELGPHGPEPYLYSDFFEIH